MLYSTFRPQQAVGVRTMQSAAAFASTRPLPAPVVHMFGQKAKTCLTLSVRHYHELCQLNRPLRGFFFWGGSDVPGDEVTNGRLELGRGQVREQGGPLASQRAARSTRVFLGGEGGFWGGNLGAWGNVAQKMLKKTKY